MVFRKTRVQVAHKPTYHLARTTHSGVEQVFMCVCAYVENWIASV